MSCSSLIGSQSRVVLCGEYEKLSEGALEMNAKAMTERLARALPRRSAFTLDPKGAMFPRRIHRLRAHQRG